MTATPTQPSNIYLWSTECACAYMGSTLVRGTPPTPPTPLPRTPWANTLVYYPFTDDYNDHSGNGYNVTDHHSTALVTLALTWVKCLNLNHSYCETNVTNTPLLINNTLPYTIVFWTLWNNPYWASTFAITWNEAGSWGWSWISAPTGTDYNNGVIECRNWYYGSYSVPESWHIKKWSTSSMPWAYWNSGVWHCFVVSYTTSWLRVYFDGSHVSAADTTWANWPDNNGSPLRIGARQAGGNFGEGYISSVIIEDKEWTAQEAADFYDTTKSYYWIS